MECSRPVAIGACVRAPQYTHAEVRRESSQSSDVCMLWGGSAPHSRSRVPGRTKGRASALCLPQPDRRVVSRDVGFAEDFAHPDAVVQGLPGARSHERWRTSSHMCSQTCVRTQGSREGTHWHAGVFEAVRTCCRRHGESCDAGSVPFSDFVLCYGPRHARHPFVNRASRSCSAGVARGRGAPLAWDRGARHSRMRSRRASACRRASVPRCRERAPSGVRTRPPERGAVFAQACSAARSDTSRRS